MKGKASAKKRVGTAPSSSGLRPSSFANHPREPWPASGCKDIFVHVAYERLKGSMPGASLSQEEMAIHYVSAKKRLDGHAANAIIKAIWNKDVQALVVDALKDCLDDPIIVYPNPGFADPETLSLRGGSPGKTTNVLPATHAKILSKVIAGEVDDRIIQDSRVGRTNMTRFARFLWQPSFCGQVLDGRSYVIVEDMVTLGGTVAALASYIHKHGGRVVAVISLASDKGPLTTPLALRQNTRRRLNNVFSSGFSDFWREAIGHAGTCLTDREGAFLVEWKPEQGANGSGNKVPKIQLLRDRLARVREKGS